MTCDVCGERYPLGTICCDLLMAELDDMLGDD